MRPRSFVPVHGTYHHLMRHAELARATGVRDTLIAQNGDVVEIDEHAVRIVDRVTSGRVHLHRGVAVSDEVLADRSRLAEMGAVAISLVVDRSGLLVGLPDVHARGVTLPGDSREWLDQARLVVKRSLRHAAEDGLLDDIEQLRDNLRRRMTRFFFDAIGMRVVCLVNLHVVR